jgi:tRNA(Ile)-lysidine synthase
MAALVLAVEVLGAGRVAAATVDHGLRPGAAAEAAAVAGLCARLGVAHCVLCWDGAEARGNLMDAARRARLELLSGWARGHGLAAVILAHTQDDQAETVLMRLARGSGVDGLAGMAPARADRGVLWLRPFLGVPRAALRQALRARGIGWAEDPTNADPRFARTRARAALAALAPLGIDAAGIAATAARLARARAALEAAEAEARARLVREDRGTARVDPAALELPGELRDRLFAGLIGALSGAPYRPRLAGLQRVLAGLAAGRAGVLGGVRLAPERGYLRLSREPAAVAGLRAPLPGPWDGRWMATGPGGAGVEIAALGAEGLRVLSRQAGAGLHPHWRETGLPAPVLAGLPALWAGGQLVSAPLAGWGQGWALRARPLAAPGAGGL